jgi:hypothetical protein
MSERGDLLLKLLLLLTGVAVMGYLVFCDPGRWAQ